MADKIYSDGSHEPLRISVKQKMSVNFSKIYQIATRKVIKPYGDPLGFYHVYSWPLSFLDPSSPIPYSLVFRFPKALPQPRSII